jgi:hypothetical protein
MLRIKLTYTFGTNYFALPQLSFVVLVGLTASSTIQNLFAALTRRRVITWDNETEAAFCLAEENATVKQLGLLHTPHSSTCSSKVTALGRAFPGGWFREVRKLNPGAPGAIQEAA